MRNLPFVGRHDELARLRHLARLGGTNVASVEAPGGMGKTRLLRELQAALEAEGDSVSAILLDLSDSRFSISLALEETILTALAGSESGRFRELRSQYTDAQSAGVSGETVRGLLSLATKEFSDTVNRRAGRSKTVLLIDTVDIPVSTSVVFRRFLNQVLSGLSDTTVILAGRDARTVLTGVNVPAAAHIDLELGPLSAADAEILFEDLELGSQLIDSLVFLSQGRPILLGLAAQWLEHDIPLPELVESNLRPASGPAVTMLHENFLSSLVKGLLGLRAPEETTTLRLAHFPHRYTAEIAGHLDDSAVGTAAANLAGMSRLFFVKHRQNSVYVLHDEMRELVNTYVWPLIDPLGLERAELDRKIVAWYDQVPASGAQDTESEWVLRAERSYYIVRGRPGEAGETLLPELREGLRSGRLDYVGLVLEMIWPLVPAMSVDTRIEMQILRSEWLRSTGRRRLAQAALEEVCESTEIGDTRRVTALCALATILCEEGKAPVARAHISAAGELATAAGDTRLQHRVGVVRGEILHAEGLIREAVEVLATVAAELELGGEPAPAAHALTRLAFSRSVLGSHERAIADARRSIGLLKAIGDKTNATAISLHTLASVMRDMSLFDDALANYGRALDLFVELGDAYWESAVFMERGLCHLLQYEEARYGASVEPVVAALDRAGADLGRSVDLCQVFNRQLLPKAVHELGHVHWEREDVTETTRLWQESLEMSQESGDLRYVLENEIGMCELDVEAGRFEMALTRRERITGYYESTRESHWLLWSRLLKLEAEAYLGLGDSANSLPRYIEAMPALARHGGWGRYRLDIELAAFRRNIDDLSAMSRLEWSRALAAAWRGETGKDLSDIPAQRLGTLVTFAEGLVRADLHRDENEG